MPAKRKSNKKKGTGKKAEQQDRGTGHPNLFIERDYAAESRVTKWAIRVETRVEIGDDDDDDELKKVIKMLKDEKFAKLARYLMDKMPHTDDTRTHAKKRARRLVAGALSLKDPHPELGEEP